MAASEAVNVRIDLQRTRENVRAIKRAVGVDVLAVIKADAYGLGAARVAGAIASDVDGFCVFSLEEATAIDLHKLTGKTAIALGPPTTLDPEFYVRAGVRPAVTTVEQAAALRTARPVLCVDTGMQRFACPPDQANGVIEAGGIEEAFTHATRREHAERLVEAIGRGRLRLHAAATSLLDDPAARLDAVRPGLACYRGVVRVAAPLVEVRDARGPAGYSGFTTTTGRHGVILAGYSNGIRRGPCLVNGQRRRIVEVGMQSAFVELGPGDAAGDEVMLLGDGVSETDVAAAWETSPHEALLHLVASGDISA